MQEKVIRAVYDRDTITVYQAYNSAIAQSAVARQAFVSPPFKKERMTWIKPSFLWMMYRSGWATKENQERILAIRLKRSGFEWALRHSCLSHFDAAVHASQADWKAELMLAPVRIQWDPEKNILLEPLPYRSIQIGISGAGVEHYVSEWVVGIEDITDYCKDINRLVEEGKAEEAMALLPVETPYPFEQDLALKVNSY